MADAPIGIFDSGYGGLTVARAVLDQLPHESVAYLGDTARQPYGPRPIAEVRRYALECMDRLVDRDVKALVIACNSASAAMLHDARERYDVPVVEVIRPAVRRAVAATRNNQVGVISTRATHQSHAYADSFAAAPQITVTSRPCPRFVEFVESGVTVGPELLSAAHEYLEPIAAQGVDTLILGCTHYPLLTGVISYVMGDDVTLVSSAEETAKDVYRVLADADALRPGRPAAAHPRVRHHRRPRRVRAARPPVPRPRGGAGHLRDRGQPMRLTVVGCSGSLAGPDSPASCYLVSAEHEGRTWRLVLDLGNGSLGALQRHVDLRDIDAVVISHLHPDHCVDLCGLYVAQRYDPRGPNPRPVPVHGPAGIAGRMARAYDLDDGEHMGAELDFREMQDRVGFEVGPFRVTPFLVNHPVEAYGLRVEAGGRTLAYTGDTDSCEALSPLCRDATLVLADSAFVDGRDAVEGIHLSGSRAARAAVGAGGVQRLMLTHLPPWNDPEVCRAQAGAVWPGEVELAAPGATYQL